MTVSVGANQQGYATFKVTYFITLSKSDPLVTLLELGSGINLQYVLELLDGADCGDD
jgi:hypothetical protein